RSTLTPVDVAGLLAFAATKPGVDTHVLPGRVNGARGTSTWEVDVGATRVLVASFGSSASSP
ncbi:hypothetical protein, partial [Deinococcus pimensis]|uniref:hypothetical protein n=1 Tax=Deinococcus pimensis TaxID=309888 RepID=UPI0005EBBAEF